MNNIKIIISVGLILLSFIILIETPSGYCLGDQILLGLGIDPRLNGFHTSFILFIFLLVLGIIGARPLVGRTNILVIVLISFTISLPIISLGRYIFLINSSGLAAIDYDIRQSRCEYKSTEDNKNISLLSTIILQNYSKKPIEFHIALQPDEYRSDLFNNEEINLVQKDTGSETFVLKPGQKQLLETMANIPNIKGYTIGGNFYNPNIVIYNDYDKKYFINKE